MTLFSAAPRPPRESEKSVCVRAADCRGRERRRPPFAARLKIFGACAAAIFAARATAQPSGATSAAPAFEGKPPAQSVFATEQPSSGFWAEHWFVRDAEHGNPPVSGRFRVNDPFAAFQKNFKDRKEVRANGMMQIPADVDVTTVRAAELYLETWGGHAGTAHKRVTVNGRTTYPLPDDGTAAYFCAHSYPSISLRITDVLRGYNVFQFACDLGTTFWGHYIIDEACLRLELPVGHTLVAQAGLADYRGRLEAKVVGEKLQLALTGGREADIAAVEFYGCYAGYEENGLGAGRQWHGFTRKRVPQGHLGTVTQPPFAVTHDVSMWPAQRDIAVRAIVRFKAAPALVYRTPIRDGLALAERPGVEVRVFNVAQLPERFWSRANKPKSAVIPLPMDAAQIERAELHTVAWTGGAGNVKDYFTLNGRHFPVAEGQEHRTAYTVFPVEPTLLRRGDNAIEVRSDTMEHGIEVLKPGPALVVRYRK